MAITEQNRVAELQKFYKSKLQEIKNTSPW